MNKLCYFAFGLNPYILVLIYSAFLFLVRKSLVKFLNNRYFRMAIILIIPTIIFIEILRNDPFFLSDDFAHLTLVSRNSYLDILRMTFTGPGIWVGHKIIIAFWLFKTIYLLWGTNILPYTIIMYLLNALNTLLFYAISEKVLKNRTIAIITSIIFGSFYLSWISNIHELLAGTFSLLTIIFWLKWLSETSKKWFFLSLGTYALAFLTKEIAFLLAPCLLILTFSMRNQLGRFKLKKALPLLFLAAIFILYSFFYARGFLGYFQIKQGLGYSMTFGPGVIWKNLVYYTSFLFPFLMQNSWLTLIFLLLFLTLDLIQKKKLGIFLVLSFLILIFPPLMFNARVSGYYTYLPSTFILLAFGLILENVWTYLKTFFKKKQIVYKEALAPLLVVLVFVFGFSLNRLFLDNCFLIQYPWKKPYKEAFYSLIRKVENFIDPERGDKYTINLNTEEQAPEIEFILGNNDITPFFNRTKVGKYAFYYDSNLKTLTVEKR
jgi:hypothetical protein